MGAEAVELWGRRCRRWPCKAMKSVKVRTGNRGKGPNWRRLYIEGDERERRVRSASVAVTTLKVRTTTAHITAQWCGPGLQLTCVGYLV